jgi:hypothetical protein
MYHIKKGSTIILIAGASVFFMINKTRFSLSAGYLMKKGNVVIPRKPLGIKYLVIIRNIRYKNYKFVIR